VWVGPSPSHLVPGGGNVRRKGGRPGVGGGEPPTGGVVGEKNPWPPGQTKGLQTDRTNSCGGNPQEEPAKFFPRGGGPRQWKAGKGLG